MKTVYIPTSVEEEFIEYLKNAESEFQTWAANKKPDLTTQDRVALENYCVAFNQLRDKLKPVEVEDIPTIEETLKWSKDIFDRDGENPTVIECMDFILEKFTPLLASQKAEIENLKLEIEKYENACNGLIEADKKMSKEIGRLESKNMFEVDALSKEIEMLRKVALELYNLVHESDLIENKIRANDLYKFFAKD